MILHDIDAIFIHIPKTAGNFLTRHVFARYSRDRISADRFHQDSEQRFNVRGDVTAFKHMSVADYARRVDISAYYLVASCREPFDRMMSLYFSPHRWFRRKPLTRLLRVLGAIGNGGVEYAAVPPVFQIDQFRELLHQAPTQEDFLRGHEQSRGLFVLRQENLERDWQQLARRFGLAACETDFSARVNVSNKPITDQQLAEARLAVGASHHRDDVAFLTRLGAAGPDS